MVRISAIVLATLARVWAAKKLGTAIAARIPIITTTISNSIKVNPLYVPNVGSFMVDSGAFDPDAFYSRQTVLRELGPKGQGKLRDSRVVVVGLGGLGSISTLYLALAGVGYLRLVDQDTVELHNLHRQVLYTVEHLRYPKAEIAAQTIAEATYKTFFSLSDSPEKKALRAFGIFSTPFLTINSMRNQRPLYPLISYSL